MKVIKHIPVPPEWESTNDWDSHRELLFLALENTTGAVCEFGCGLGSTNLLDKYCHEKGRRFISVETNGEWRNKAICEYNVSLIGESYLNIMEEWPEDFKENLSILFVDSAPGEERKEVIKKYLHRADVIIAHDVEPGAEYVYGMTPILSTFKYRLDFTPEGKPHTCVVSNVIDVTQWINQP